MSAVPVPPPPAPRRRRMVRPLAIFAVLGPGVIAASAGNDAGGITTYASAGSEFVYSMLFVMVLVTVALVVVQEMSARLGAYTGEGLISLVREQFSLRMGAFAVARAARREPRARRLRVRGHRRGDGDLRRLPVHLGADLRRW